MNRSTSKIGHPVWSVRLATLVAIIGLGLLLTASGANAGCAIPFSTKAPAASPIPFVISPSHDDWNGPSTIVGLWHVIYTATYANGPFPAPPFQFNQSFKMWHADGTEFENAFLPPSSGNICYGVWSEGKGNIVKLHHLGLMFDSTTGNLTNVFSVDETNTVSRDGKTYTGTFDFKLFPPTDVFATGVPLAEVKGTTSATRIQPPKQDD